MLNLQFLTETPPVRTGVEHFSGHKSRQEVAWNTSGLDPVAIIRPQGSYLQVPASWDDDPLRTVANWSGGLTLDVDFKYKKPSLCVTEPPETPLDATNRL